MAYRTVDQTQPIRGALAVGRRERVLLLLAAAFVCTAAFALHLVYAPFGVRRLVMTCGVFLGTFGTAHLALSRRLTQRDPFLLPAGALLSGWGLVLTGRLAPGFLSRQATWLMLGVVAMLIVTEVGNDLRWLRRYRYTWLAAGLSLLAATLLLGVNPSGAGPRLWLPIGGAYFQPSEPLKLLMVVYLASYLAQRRKLLVSEGRRVGPIHVPPLAYVGPLLVMFGVAVLLLAVQQDLGAAMLFFLTFLSMLYLATGQWGYVAAGLLLFAGAGVLGYSFSQRLALRVDAWVNPWAGAADWSFQVVQSLLAFGAGGVFGEGLGLGRPTFIPAVHTDFTFAAIAESFGLVGVLVVIALYGLLLLRGFRVAASAGGAFERYLGTGLTAGLVVQAWVIMAANAKLAPIAGVTLPFLSYGGSSLVSTFVALGLLVRISHSPGLGPDEGSGLEDVFFADRGMRLTLIRTAGVLTVALGVLALVCGYWTVVRSTWLVARADNPRRVSYERRIVRGSILDRHGETLAGVEVGPSGLVTRTYPAPEAAPVIGYATLRYGTGGIEAAFDTELRGEANRGRWERSLAELLHRPPQGQDVQLTLDIDLQRRIEAALDGETGAAVLVETDTGRILAMGSSPTFDPARLAQQWEDLREDGSAPLLNRATQGLYQPGAALQTVIVGEALRSGLVPNLNIEVGFPLTERIVVDGAAIGCREHPDGTTMRAAYRAACPAPIGGLGERLGADGMADAVERWHLSVPPQLVISTDAGDWSREMISSSALEAIGQGELAVSPLRMALVAATVANGGTTPSPRLVSRIRDSRGVWRERGVTEDQYSVLSSTQAEELLSAWQRCPLGASVSDLGGVLGHWGAAVSGEGEPHAWFLGVAPAGAAPRYAVSVLVEHAADPERAAAIGVEVLEASLRDDQ